MPVVRLTDLSIQKLSAEKQTRFMDVNLRGFGLLVGKSRKTFILVSGRTRKLTALGRYPSISLHDARQQALAIIDGKSPESTDTEACKAPQAVKTYLAAMEASAAHRYGQTRLLTKHFLSRHQGPLPRITKKDILAITDGLRDRPSEQIHMHRALKAFFNWALSRDLVSATPLAGLSLPSTPKTRERVLSNEELKAIWYASHECGDFGAIVRRCILLGVRPGESYLLPSLPTNGEVLALPATSTKNKREHLLPLTPNSLKHLSTTKPSFKNWGRPKDILDEKCGVTGWTCHDLRRTFATILAQLDVEPHIIERLLNHKNGEISGVSAIYNRFKYLPQMRAALETYERHLVAIGLDL